MAFRGAAKSPLDISLTVASSTFLESQFKGLAAIPFLTLLSMASTLGQFSTTFSWPEKSPLPRVQVSVIFTRKMAQTTKIASKSPSIQEIRVILLPLFSLILLIFVIGFYLLVFCLTSAIFFSITRKVIVFSFA